MNLRLWLVGGVGLTLLITAPFLANRDGSSPGPQYGVGMGAIQPLGDTLPDICLLYTSDAADE